MRSVAVTILAIFFGSVSFSCSSNNVPTNSAAKDAGVSNSSSDLSAATGMFLDTQAADSNDCSTDPALHSNAGGGQYCRFTPTEQNGEQVIVETVCGSSLTCDNPDTYTWRLNAAGVWARPDVSAWQSSPACKYIKSQLTLEISSSGLLTRQLSYEAPLDLVNGQCPQTVAQNLTCAHIYLRYFTRVSS